MKSMKKNISSKNKPESTTNKLSEDMQNEIKDAFMFYDPQHTGSITRQSLRSILGNFAFTKMNGKEIEDQITNQFQSRQSFSLYEIVDMITKKWFYGRGREEEAVDMFSLFDKRQRGLVGLNQIKAVFNQYLDINISDNDIMEFIQQADVDKDGYLNQHQFSTNAMDQIHKYLNSYDDSIVNRLETQTRQPSLYFSTILIDHEQSFEVMNLLIEHNANPHFKDNYQQTVLFYVCRQGKEKCLDLLLEQGLSLNDEDIYGQTPLYYVAKENRVNIIHKLIERKVDLNHCDKIANQTPLFYAAREGHFQMCKILVESGCDVSLQDSQHKMASHYAKKFGKNDVFEYLSNEFQNMKNQKRITLDSSRGQQSNPEQKYARSKKKKDISNNIQTKNIYRLYRADALGNSTELNLTEFQQFIANYPQLQEMLRNPDQIDMKNLQEIKAKDAWIKIASKVLTQCWKNKGGYYFHDPVDPSKYNIDDYFQIILEPMDFGTIKRKLNHNVYNNVQEFITDMKLVFDNCVKYNGMQNTIAKFAIQIKNIFQENMKQMGFMN